MQEPSSLSSILFLPGEKKLLLNQHSSSLSVFRLEFRSLAKKFVSLCFWSGLSFGPFPVLVCGFFFSFFCVHIPAVRSSDIYVQQEKGNCIIAYIKAAKAYNT